MNSHNFTNPPRPKFPVVALCGSAGGLEAFQAFFDTMPENSGMAFIVVQHLADSQVSVLHELIQHHTPMKVESIIDNTTIEADHVYVLPAGYDLDLWNGHLQLTTRKRTDKGWPKTIDQFLTSLANDQGLSAVALIFSGAGSDGLEGVRVVKQNGGYVIAQDLDSAIQSSMPGSVITAGLADVVSPSAQMPGILLARFANSIIEVAPPGFQIEEINEADMQRVIRRLQRLVGRDFTDYKRSTFERQLQRRMSISQYNTVDAYLDYMSRQPEEADYLMKSLLINVTSFFRDGEPFDSLKEKALLPMLRDMDIDVVFRAWVPGCATGEEAVSIAILIHECLEELDMTRMEVRIFATDANHEVIQRARNGFYSAAIADDISLARLEANFIAEDNGYRLRNHIGRMITWAVHNLTEHPPFSKQHLISCRNVMIYFQQNLQERLVALFAFALRPHGILFLGMSESLPYNINAFGLLESKHKIYQRVEDNDTGWLGLDKPLYLNVANDWNTPMPDDRPRKLLSQDHELDIIKNLLFEHYNSTCVIVDDYHRLRYSYGEIDRYLKIVPGREGQHNILDLAREGLDLELAVALHTAQHDGASSTRRGVWVKTNGDERIINLIVKPIPDGILPGARNLIIFEMVHERNNLDTGESNVEDDEAGTTIRRLREELTQAQRSLQSVTQALQAKSEELTSSLEEVRSASEELQATNEELRTSKEELESMNEELNTLNTQLTDQNYELNQANNTLHNFLQSTEIGTIFLDEDLGIRDFTASVTDIFRLRDGDKGRPLVEIADQLEGVNLIADAESVLDTLDIIEKEVRTTNGAWYQLHIRPYRTTVGIVDGLVLTFSNITGQKEAQMAAEVHSDYIREIFDTIDHSLLELDSNLQVLNANRSFYTKFRANEVNTVGRPLHQLGDGQWDIPELRRLLTEIIPQQRSVRDYTVKHDFPNLGVHTVQINARQIAELDRILLVITDISAEG